MDFETFDESIGTDGYYNLIRRVLFPNSRETSFTIAYFNAVERNYPKGSYFSRVRGLSHERANAFLNDKVDITEFYPPRPNVVNIPQGRFNQANNATMYLADHPYVAMQECDIKPGDFFLLSYFSLPKNMCFMHLEDGKDKVSSMLYNLFKSRDKRFYPVINLVYSDLVNFDKHDGIAYDSSKINVGYENLKRWGPISSVVNFAIQKDNIKNFKLAVSWLMYCDEDYNPVQYSIFTPLSNKKRSRLSKLNFKGNEKKFIALTNKVNDGLHEDSRKGKILMDRGNLKASNEIPFRIIKN
ncbi:hypothetical protein [Pantoea eucalypti]|uniref:hypothetical protein n=1 Tax=Pantoea eucalypti TaxID=470933 RepID=UPI00289F8754|nr:hypothetical protein [Pantoea eucalypti]